MTFISVFTASPEHVLLTVENTSTFSGGRKFLSNMKEGEGTAVRKVRFSHFPSFGRGVDPADRRANETGPWELSAAFFFTPVTCPFQASSVSLSYPPLIISYHFLLLSCSPVYSLTLPHVLLHQETIALQTLLRAHFVCLCTSAFQQYLVHVGGAG